MFGGIALHCGQFRSRKATVPDGAVARGSFPTKNAVRSRRRALVACLLKNWNPATFNVCSEVPSGNRLANCRARFLELVCRASWLPWLRRLARLAVLADALGFNWGFVP